MTETFLWRDLIRAIDQHASATNRVRFWLRDDDAVEPTPALDRLRTLCEAHDVPLLLAVIPKPAQQSLGDYVRDAPLITPCQHGYAHINHAGEHGRAQELGLHRGSEQILQELREGQARMSELFNGTALPLLVPPWNRIDPALVAELPGIGFRALSTFGWDVFAPVAHLRQINSDVDIIDWRNGRIGKPIPDLIGTCIDTLTHPANADKRIGILTHHLAHDDGAWAFLEALFAETAGHPHVEWVPAAHFMNDA
ncbi:polysaccharide deacetylase family protein [Methylovirgula sp. 4M-Z18]|uniref:polysaccharide deacetylase family protein n=1 Tax=Methylovirgula sp. 4M-Z18 TaxID=2293567 RepID=UPI000E2ECD16|nr:polysaccharide deacetylase family protein [Methylovirgula sp. 4M-Z18]RFB79669.1 polysaccharide deacetylase [Methylovirgula sp. 4M-Z18]